MMLRNAVRLVASLLAFCLVVTSAKAPLKPDGVKSNLAPEKNKLSPLGDGDASADNFMKDMLQKAGMDPSQMEELMASMPSGEGEGEGGMEEGLNMMSSMMKSPIFQDYMSDPEKLEQSRQMILQNPMLKGMMGGMPGMEELLNNPDAWREAMQAAANMYQNMDSGDLMKAMEGMGGMPGGGMPGMEGMFGDIGNMGSSAATTAALDELSEDDE